MCANVYYMSMEGFTEPKPVLSAFILQRMYVYLSTLCGTIRETYKRKLKTNFLSKPMHALSSNISVKNHQLTQVIFSVLMLYLYTYTHTHTFFRNFFLLFSFSFRLNTFFFSWLETLNFTCTASITLLRKYIGQNEHDRIRLSCHESNIQTLTYIYELKVNYSRGFCVNMNDCIVN